MPHRACTVSFERRGVRHEAKVDATTVYEAAVLALKQWDSRRYVSGPTREATFEIEVVAPRRFRVRYADVLDWLYRRPAKTRDEHERKQRLRALLAHQR
jgi:hypothetical protein